MFNPSKLVKEDVGDNLMSFFSDLEAENRRDHLRREINNAKCLLKCLKEKESALKKSFLPSESNTSSLAENQSQRDFIRQENEIFKLSHGIELCLNYMEPKAQLTITPSYRGVFYGPFNIVFTKKGDDYIIHSYQLLEERSFQIQAEVQVMKSILKKRFHKEFMKKPYSIVPLVKLSENYLQPGKCNIWEFSKSVNLYLTSYISRLSQIKSLEDYFGPDSTDLEFNDKITRLSFTLHINDFGDDDISDSPSGFKVSISLKYELSCDLPKPGSLGLRVDDDAVKSLGQDGVEKLKNQFELLYIKPLSEALIDGF